VKRLHVDLTCPRCGGELLEGEAAILSPDRTTYTTRCDHCLDLYRLELVATVVEPWPVDRCDPEARRVEAATAAALMEATSF
jgi:hypothetical protein